MVEWDMFNSDYVRAFVEKYAQDKGLFNRKASAGELVWRFAGRIDFVTEIPVTSNDDEFVDQVMIAYHSDPLFHHEMQDEMEFFYIPSTSPS